PRSLLHRTWEGEEGVGCHHCAARTLPGPLSGDTPAVDAVWLPADDTDGGFAGTEYNGVRAHMLAGFPGEAQRGPLCFGWAAPCYHPPLCLRRVAQVQ